MMCRSLLAGQQGHSKAPSTGYAPCCHNGAGRHCEAVTRQAISDVLRYREYGPASRRYSA
eukprot:354346-Chlamydomonas_euryale.AAC.1